MIRVIMEYKVKKGADILPTLQKLRWYVVTFEGFVSAENLRNEQDSSIVAMVTSWENLEQWKKWESSTLRKQILEETKRFLQEEPKVTIYKLIPTAGW